MLQFDCPKCQTQLQFDESARGTIVRCTACNQQLSLPAGREQMSEQPLPSRNQQVQATPPLLPDEQTIEWPYFEPARPRFGSGMNPAGAILLPLVLIPTAVGMGALGSFVSQWVHIIIVFPALIGAGVGVAGLAVAHFGKVRSIVYVALLGSLAAVVTMLSGFYFEYQRFSKAAPQLAELPDDVRQQQITAIDRLLANANMPDNERENLELQRDGLRVRGLFSYIDFRARIGVKLGRISRPNRRGGLNLGYVGSYIYWGVEFFIIWLIIVGLIGVKATQPFCDQCNTWKQRQFLGGLNADVTEANRAIEHGDLSFLVDHVASSMESNLQVNACVCPNCESHAPIDLQMFTQATTKQAMQQPLARATYPGEALPVFEELFRPRRRISPRQLG